MQSPSFWQVLYKKIYYIYAQFNFGTLNILEGDRVNVSMLTHHPVFCCSCYLHYWDSGPKLQTTVSIFWCYCLWPAYSHGKLTHLHKCKKKTAGNSVSLRTKSQMWSKKQKPKHTYLSSICFPGHKAALCVTVPHTNVAAVCARVQDPASAIAQWRHLRLPDHIR